MEGGAGVLSCYSFLREKLRQKGLQVSFSRWVECVFSFSLFLR